MGERRAREVSRKEVSGEVKRLASGVGEEMEVISRSVKPRK